MAETKKIQRGEENYVQHTGLIYFPHLGIYLEHVGKTLTVFGFDIAYYGIVIVTGMLIGVAVTSFW